MPPSRLVPSILPWCYNDPDPVAKELDKKFGANQYRLSVKGNQYLVEAPRKLQPGEIRQIHDNVKWHYRE
ncbi:hypothetical protein CH063_00576 [Colletotrichum higginsianum]|uniref:Uncharacterized protein n=4 Tax=Colletotrichum destructivum species complex TaxID=2707350 RepID=H1VZS0_COLHI|nr:hypothetical protein CH35J_001934 [Colletotrichum higginsianum]WQF78789.1 hypothetical protein CDEST_03803 [Colletotrichum destructivum]GJC91384.1 hypothetical protein ColKHC_00210 [Colletotrichum higginsianum]CCF45732.1 hypothetical protein CH063_00576 [Colletotrichum higginsianum]